MYDRQWTGLDIYRRISLRHDWDDNYGRIYLYIHIDNEAVKGVFYMLFSAASALYKKEMIFHCTNWII